MSTADQSPKELPPLSEEDLKIAEDNLVRCLDALDQRGEEGLQDELDRMYPGTERPQRVPLFTSSHATLRPRRAATETPPSTSTLPASPAPASKE